MSTIQLFNNDILNCRLSCLIVNDNVWFKAKDVSTVLGYAKTDQAIRKHVDDDKKKKLNELYTPQNEGMTDNVRNPIYIKESGLYQLIFSSKKPEAKAFTNWVVEDVLPTIRKQGSYIPQITKHDQVKIMNEYDLQTSVISYIKKFYPYAIIVPGLGELQDTSDKRIKSKLKGYRKGQPDLIVLNKSKPFNGFAIEFKSPTGDYKISEQQHDWLNDLSEEQWYTIITTDYDVAIHCVEEYFKKVKKRPIT